MSKRPKIQGISRTVAFNIRHARRVTRLQKQIARRRNRGA